jgi:GMP reductase
MTCLHKYYSNAELIEYFKDEPRCLSTFYTLGIKEDETEKLRAVKAKADIRFVCIDAANGYTKYFVDRVKSIREEFPELTVMAGNVATPEMVQELLISGAADIVKIGIGSGSVCTTRMTTAVGYPQL